MTPEGRIRAGRNNGGGGGGGGGAPPPTCVGTPDLTIRLSTYHEGQVLHVRCPARWTDGHAVVVRAVLKYLEDVPFPRAMRATIEKGTRRAYYFILFGNNDIRPYLHAGLFSVDGGNAYYVQARGRHQAARSYDLRFYANMRTPIHREQIECRHADIPGRLARAGAKYLANGHGRGAMMVATAATTTTTSRHRTKYMLMLEDGTLNVYRYVDKYTIVEATK